MRMKNNYISRLHFISKHLVALLVLGLLFARAESVSGQIAQRGTATTNTSTNTSVIVNVPTGVTAGDLMIADLASYANGTGAASCSGWTLISSGQLGGSSRRYGTLLYRIATATEPASYTFTTAAASSFVGSIIAFSGVNTISPFDATNNTLSVSGSTSATSLTGITQITTVTTNTVVLLFGMSSGGTTTASTNFGSYTATSPATLTEVADRGAIGGTTAAVGVAWAKKTSAGATGTGSLPTVISSGIGGQLVALKPQKQFKSIATGNWGAATTWQESTDGGSSWAAATTIPTSGDNLVTIQNSHTVSLTADATASSLTINSGGTLDLNGRTLSTPNSVTLNGTGVGNNGALINSSGTAVTFASNITGTYSVGGSGAITLTGNVQGTLTKVGANTLTLGGTPDNIALGVIANSGTVILAKTSTSGVHAIGGGGLTIGGATVQLGGTGGDQIYDGCTVTINSGTFDLNAQSESIDGLTGSGGTILNNGVGASTLTFGIGNSSNTYSGIFSNGSGGLSLVKAGTGTETFNGLNTYSGSTTVNGGILKAGVANQSFGIASAITLANVAGVGLDITGFNTIIGSLTGGGATGGNVTLGSNILTIGSNNTSPAAYVGIISGTGGITKNGTGTLTLSGANTYTGTTTISAGILKLNNITALGSTSSTSVTTGGTLDLNGITLSTAIPLTLNGTGVSSGGALINSSGTPTNYNGAITLGSASSIGATGNITLGAAITGGQDLTKVGAGILSLGSGSVTLGKLNISAGTLTSTSGTMTLTGDFTNNATFTHNSGTVTMSGAAQSITGATTFYNLTLAGSGTKTFTAATTTSNNFNINNGVIADLGNGLTHTANAYYLGAALQYKGSWGSTGSNATYTNDTNFDVAASGILNTTTGACGPGYWTGATDTNWNTPSNWCDGNVPTKSTNVYIPNVNNEPVIGTAGGLCKNITIETSSSLTLNVVTNLFVYGNWTNNGSFSASGIGSVIFSGTTSQTIGGSLSTSFYNLTIQNSGAVGSNLVTLNKPTTVTGVLLLVDGNLVTNSTNLISINKNSNSAIMGGSSSSYIDGPVIWSLPAGLTTGTTYNFPVGDNTAYLPFTLVNPSTSAGTTALVKAFNANSGGTGNGISTTEYWQLTTAPGFTNSSVSLGKGSNTVYPYDLILGNTAKAGAYTSLGGTTGFYDITNSSAIGANSFFALGTSATPKINFVPVILGGFFYIYNFGPSNEQTFILNGTSLTEGITVSAPTHFEISLTSGTGFAPSIVLPIVSGNKVNTTPIYIRLKSGLAIGTYSSEKVTMVSTGATTKEITCEGTVFATTPTIITTGGRNCPPNNTQIQLGSSGDNINILYWTGPNNYYSQSPNPFISPANATYDGTYTVTGSLPTGGNLINNGDFELQNVGFSSSYAFVDSTSVPTSTCYNFILGCEGTYTVLKSPKSVHGNFLPAPDHSNPGTFQMVINGATTANVSVWSQTVKVIPNSTYQFSYWLQSVNLENPSKLQLYANNQPVGTIFTASSAAGWNQYFYNWNSGSNTDVVLDLRNQNIVPNGNDFALDDIIFRTVTQVSSSINVTSTNVVAVSITTPTTTVTTGTNVTFSATPTNGGTSPDYVWTVTNGASSTSYPVTKSSSFSYVPTAGDVVSCVMTSNSTCITGNPATSNAITMIVNGNKNLWIGAPGIGGTVWSDKANWTATKVPASGDNVEFATTGNNSGVAAKNDLYVDYNRIVGNIINNASGKNLIIPADKEVVVNNLITLTPVNTSSTYDQIQIKCDPNPIDASRLPNGSIIFKNASNVNGTVEMYSKSYIDNSATDDTQKYFWQYFGIPVETTTAEPTLYGAYVRKSNEAGDETDANYYWTELNNASVLNAFDGYEICQPTKTTYTFTGQLVNRSLNQPTLPYSTGVDVKYRGENLLANPYTAAIDVNKINFGTNVEAAVYLYNTGSYGQWNAATTLGNNPGQYICIPKLPAGNNGLPQEVPSMSSMLVKATAVSNGGISFNYNDVIKKNETIQRVKSVDAISSTDLISTMIDLTGQHYSDRMWIFTEPSCTRNFDNGWDGRKILGSSLAPQIYAIEPDGDYQVNSVSDMYNTDLAFQAGDEVEYTLKFTHQNIQQRYAGVYLVDLIENKTVDVTQSGSTYTFATAQSDTPAKRFKILTRSYEKDAPDTEAQVKIFTAPGRVFVHNLTTFKGECTLYDIAGRAIKNASFAANAVTEVLSNLTPGAYVVNTITNGEKLSKRVIVQ